MTTASYGKYWIQPMSYREYPSRRWIPKVRLLQRFGGSRDITELTPESRRFDTRQGSDDHAMAVARMWIDRK